MPKHQRRFDGFDEQIIALYARGMTVRDIPAHLLEMYQVEVSPELISHVTEAVLAEAQAWQTRPLEESYPIVWFDALVVKIRHEGRVEKRTVYIALALRWDGHKEVLGLWFGGAEGAKFWLSVVTELPNRGVKDLLIACVDGLKGFPEAIESVFPQTVIQLCLVHLVRHSLKLVRDKERTTVAADLKRVYGAATAFEAERQLAHFEQQWGRRYPLIAKSWRTHWARIVPMFDYPAEIRRVIYTTNAIESLNSTLRRAVNPRTLFPTQEAALKVLYLALGKVSLKWTMPLRDWKRALQQFAILFGERVPLEW